MKQIRLGRIAAWLTLVGVSSLPMWGQKPEQAGENLLRLEGTDAATGIHYLRLILLLKSPDATAGVTDDGLPRFTMECREHAGKRSLHWLVRFQGSPDFAFLPPFVPTAADPQAPPNPSVNLKMRFEGYMKSEEFKRQWEVQSNGELHYRNPGFGSANLDDPRHFMQWLTSLPNLRIAYAKPLSGQPSELVFPTKPLLDLVKNSELCQP